MWKANLLDVNSILQVQCAVSTVHVHVRTDFETMVSLMPSRQQLVLILTVSGGGVKLHDNLAILGMCCYSCIAHTQLLLYDQMHKLTLGTAL